MCRAEWNALKDELPQVPTGFQHPSGRGFDRRLEDFDAALVSDCNVVAGFRERRPLRSNSVSNELSMIFRFLAGPALMSEDIMS